MRLTNTKDTYGSIAKFFHWLMALLLIAQYCTIYVREYLSPANTLLRFNLLVDWHKPLGILLLLLLFFRLTWRLTNTIPTYETSMPLWEKMVAKSTHFSLYICMLVMPASGIIMSQAAGYTANFFFAYQLPALCEKNAAISHIAHETHTYASWVLMALVVLHVLASLKHHFILKDRILRRMMPFNGL